METLDTFFALLLFYSDYVRSQWDTHNSLYTLP